MASEIRFGDTQQIDVTDRNNQCKSDRVEIYAAEQRIRFDSSATLTNHVRPTALPDGHTATADRLS